MERLPITTSCLLGLAFHFFMCASARAEPPYWGTIFLDPDIITEADPTSFESLVPAGRGDRWMFDRRENDWVFLRPFLFEARYDDGLTIEIQVNPEFGTVDAARVQAETYAPVIGRLPTGLRKDVETSWIHRGVQPFGGGNNNLLIHIGQAKQYAEDGILEETLVHEASHTSLDAEHANAVDWLAAQKADAEFISTYARDNPTREDIAESYLLYLALRHRRDRISDSLADTIVQTMPNRVAYFDTHPIDLHPLVSPDTTPGEIMAVKAFSRDLESGQWRLLWSSTEDASYAVERSLDLQGWVDAVGEIPSQGKTTEVLLDPETPDGGAAYFRIRRLATP